MALAVVMPFRHNTKDRLHEGKCPHQQDLYENVHCSFLQSSYRLQTPQRHSSKGAD